MKVAVTTLAFCVAALLALGLVMLYSSSMTQVGAHYLMLQLVWCVFGFVLCVAATAFDYQWLKKAAWPLFIFALVLLVLVVLPLPHGITKKINGAHRWFILPGMRLQPSELAKLAVIFYLAWFIEIRSRPRAGGAAVGINDVFHSLAPVLGTLLLVVGLVVAEPDMGTACMISLIAFVMLFVSGLSLRYVAGAIAVAMPAVYLLIVRVPYRLQRVQTFFSPGSDPQGHGFQLLQSLISVGSGGFTGVGLMESHQKLFFLPEAHTDFIFAVICEELGFIGAVIVLGLFAVYGWRGFLAAMKAPDRFGRLLAIGITTMVVGQALVNLSVVLGLLPTKGIPLPFVSYGGSSLLGMLLATGVLLNISQHAETA